MDDPTRDDVMKGFQEDDRRELETLAKEVFALVEIDQGKGFVPSASGGNFDSPDQFFAYVRSWEMHTRSAADKLRKFLKDHRQL